MQINMPHIVRLTVVLSVVGLAVVGCGRKGDLDPPSASATKGGDVSKPTKQPGTEDKKFFLDPLL
ncbi:MAG: lipoprotein [Rhizobium sp.]|uniref:LPS translocon maturation chaperone LptM n=1 Tax=Rhizobium sp. SYY.PMSO TaxID=3382192 RepID=UPI000DDAC30A